MMTDALGFNLAIIKTFYGLLTCGAALSFFLMSCPAQAKGRIAAVIVEAEEKWAELAEGAGEVVVSAIGANYDGTIIGTHELRVRLGMEGSGDVARCVSDSTCLARAATALGVGTIIVGFVGGDEDAFRFSLQLVDVKDGHVVNQVFRSYPPQKADLFNGMPKAVKQLFTSSANYFSGNGSAVFGQSNQISWYARKQYRPLGLGSFGLGVLMVGAGGLLNHLSYSESKVHNDESVPHYDALAAKSRSENLWMASMILYGMGGALAALGGVAIFLPPTVTSSTPVARLDSSKIFTSRSLLPTITPLAGGGALSWQFPLP